MNFATTVNRFSAALVPANSEQVEQAKKWVDDSSATGGTAIDGALDAALESRGDDHTRPYTVVFFTDGQPTVGETNPDKILAKVIERNTANTRIFTFGVGDDVNAALLDQLADKTRAVSTYVRPEEDIEVKTSGLFSKISHPVLTDLKLTAGKDVTLTEIYPVQLPDLFHGSQLVVLGRYHGKGHTAVTLTGSVGKEKREFVYEVTFPTKTDDEKAFVLDLWARRKVGYLLEQIRSNGEKKELVEEVVALAKKHGIATPYTSYLVVPDGAPQAPVAMNGAQPATYGIWNGASLMGVQANQAPPPLLGSPAPAMVPPTSGPASSAAPVGGGYGRIIPPNPYVSPTMQWATPSAPTATAIARSSIALDGQRQARPPSAAPTADTTLYLEGIAAAPGEPGAASPGLVNVQEANTGSLVFGAGVNTNTEPERHYRAQ